MIGTTIAEGAWPGAGSLSPSILNALPFWMKFGGRLVPAPADLAVRAVVVQEWVAPAPVVVADTPVAPVVLVAVPAVGRAWVVPVADPVVPVARSAAPPGREVVAVVARWRS